MMILFINLIGVALIFGIAWWFWWSKPPSLQSLSGNIIEIKVKNGIYQPSHIEAKTGQKSTLRFIREDSSPCAEFVIFSALNINKKLPLNQPVEIPIQVEKPGIYEFTCQMGMYRGKLIVK